MLDVADIEAALHRALPAELQGAASRLAQLVSLAFSGQVDAAIRGEEELQTALRALAGQSIVAGQSVVNFGSGNQFGDISIGDIAGGDLLKITVHIAPKPSVLTPKDQRNRRAMLTKLRGIWIDGFLNELLPDELRIELNLIARPDAVAPPINMLYQERGQNAQPLPTGIPISEVFDRAGGELLILGASGTGKTTLLVKLLQALLQRAEEDETYPIPVIFNLSTWATERRPIGEWMAEELSKQYDVPKKVAQAWLEANAILPLLDGLDEVAEAHRDACVAAMNQHRALSPTAVCSRSTEYQALAGKLTLQGAVGIETLTPTQVEHYLAHRDKPLQAVGELLRRDPVLAELLNTPLMVRVVTLTFGDASLDELQTAGTVDERRARVWEAYITQMFARRGKSVAYARQQTEWWLAWLARQLASHALSIYYIEGMQPDWLSQRQRWMYALLIRLTVGLVFGLSSGLGIGLVLALVGTQGLGLVLGLLLGLSGALLGGRGGGRITLVEGFSWSWAKVETSIVGALVVGLCFGLGVGLVWGLSFGLLEGLAWGLGTWLTMALLWWLAVGLLSGLDTREVEVRTVPNQGIRRSVQSGLTAGLLGGLVSGLVWGLLGGLAVGLVGGPGLGVVWGLLGGLVGALLGGLSIGLRFGGATAIQHAILRYLLSRQGSLPFRDLIPWLDHCVERLFLHRVGGGYVFIHRMLLEHFAARHKEPDN